MEYNTDDTIKLDVEQQRIIEPYALVCPYVRVARPFAWMDGDLHNTSVYAYATFWNWDSGEQRTDIAYHFNPEGSRLVRDAMPVSA